MAGKTDAFVEQVKSMRFEQAIARLEEIVEQIESGKAGLEESIAIYEEGMILKAHCQKKLEEARLRIEKVAADAGQPIKLEQADSLRQRPGKPDAGTS